MSYVGNTNTTQAFTPAIDYFSGNGSTVAFTLSRPVASVAQVQVVVNNVAQNPSDAFTVLNNTITFTGAPSSGTNNIYVQYTSPITQVIQPGQGTVTSNSFGLITDFTTTGNTVLGNASTDTLNVGNGGLVKDASGNVGIGTSSPSTKLQVAGVAYSSTGGLAVGDGSSFTPSGLNSIPNYGVGFTTTGSITSVTGFGGINFYTAQVERARIDQSGNLLVGRTSAYTDGTLGTPLLQVTGVVGAAAAAGFIATTTGSINMVGFVNPNGTVGSIFVSGSSTVYGTSSDYRLKEAITPMQNALARVAALKPVTYKWKVDGSDGEGFIAHELQAVVPDCVTGEKDEVDGEGNPKYQGIDTSFLVATLTAAIQELKAIVDAQGAEIAALKGAQ